MSQNAYRKIGERIRVYRKLAHLTQERLAEKADLSAHFFGRIERGDGRATVESLERIAKALGVQLEELFQFRKEEPHEAKELLQQIHRLLKDRRPEELRFLRHLVGQFVEVLLPVKRT